MVKKNPSDPAVFDKVAAEYDRSFTDTKLGRMLRGRVWLHLHQQFQNGQQLLDLASGTGEDALWLAQQGIHVLGLDGSSEMVQLATRKADNSKHSGDITIRQCSLEEFANQPRSVTARISRSSILKSTAGSPNPEPRVPSHFDGAISNFGGLNTIDGWHELAKALALLIRTGGKIVLVPMGPVCPWEAGWYLVHGRPKTAIRRLGRNSVAKVGDSHISIWYPSPGRLKRDFQPWFTPVLTESLGLLLPPSYLAHLVERWPRIFNLLDNIEKKMATISLGWGDHYILILERNETGLEV